MSQISHFPSHNPDEIGRLLDFYINSDDRGVHRSHTTHLSSHNHGRQYNAQPRFPEYACTRGEQREGIQ